MFFCILQQPDNLIVLFYRQIKFWSYHVERITLLASTNWAVNDLNSNIDVAWQILVSNLDESREDTRTTRNFDKYSLPSRNEIYIDMDLCDRALTSSQSLTYLDRPYVICTSVLFRCDASEKNVYAEKRG